MNVPRALIALAALAAALALAAPASAAPRMESIFQDDDELLNRGPEATRAGLDQMRALGATTIHALIVWAQVAPDRQATEKPDRFAARDPGADGYNWTKYDTLVREAAARGMSIIFTPTTPAPAWAGDCKTSSRRAFCNRKPNPKEYAAFIEALARRYSGEFPDPEDPYRVLPRVSRWSFMNEPNLGAWLTPQYERIRGRVVPTGAKLYRELAYAGIKAMRENGHARDELYIAETAPVGGSGSTLATRKNPPRSFLRSVFCLRSNGRPLRDSRIGCGKRFRQFRIAGITHHPYTLGAGAPPYARTGRDNITIGYLSRLTGLLRQAVRQKRIPSSAGRRIFLDEMGYQTNPPDDVFGVPFNDQARLINQADYIAYRNGFVRGVSQYELYDSPAKDSFNTGLITCRDCGAKLKPSFGAYRLPIYVVRDGRKNVRIFGWARPARTPQNVEVRLVLRRDGKKVSDRVIGQARTNSAGIFFKRFPRRAGEYQLRWFDGDKEYVSRPARVALR